MFSQIVWQEWCDIHDFSNRILLITCPLPQSKQGKFHQSISDQLWNIWEEIWKLLTGHETVAYIPAQHKILYLEYLKWLRSWSSKLNQNWGSYKFGIPIDETFNFSQIHKRQYNELSLHLSCLEEVALLRSLFRCTGSNNTWDENIISDTQTAGVITKKISWAARQQYLFIIICKSLHDSHLLHC